MPDFMKSLKRLTEQSDSERIYVLKQVAHHMLGAKWKYYHKIKRGGEGLSIFKEKTLMEQMKATQSALRFTSKSAKSTYRSAYQNCLKDIAQYTGLKKELFPELPEAVEGQETPSLTSQFDEVIISWTPLKFFIPAKKIREKGKATQRHTEGLVAKLFFKVSAFYSAPENWNKDKISLYVRNLEENSSYQDVVAALEPLKNDLNQFVEAYEPFKFGKATLTKGVEQESDAFDDAMAVESFESQVRSLYWYNIIYWAVETFLFRYYLTLITSTRSTQAIRYLTVIFESAFEKAIDNKSVFIGSFEVDRTKKIFREPFEEYKKKRREDPRSTKLKTRKGIYETYLYNHNLLENLTISFEISEIPGIDSEWAKYLKEYFLALYVDRPEKPATELDEHMEEIALSKIPLEIREYAFMQLMAVMVKCTQANRKARHKILERFKKRVVADKEFAEKQILEIKKRGEKQIRKLERKFAKIKRLKQDDAAQVFENDVQSFQKKLDARCNSIRQNASKELNAQKERLQILFKEIAKEDSVHAGLSANYIYKLLAQIDEDRDFVSGFLKSTIDNVQHQYSKELEPFYENLFEILDPSTQEKIVIIQALKKSGGEKSINLTLTQEEEMEFENMVAEMKSKIEQSMPGIFSCKVFFLSQAFPVEDLFRISVDKQSMKKLLRLKFAQANTGKKVNVPPETAKALLVLNMVVNPVPKNNLIMEGKQDEQDPHKAINSALLNKLLADIS